MEPTMPVSEAARLLKVTPRTIRNWAAQGRLRATRISPRVMLVPLSEVNRLTGSLARPDLSSVIWDVELSTLDEDHHADFIIRRVLEGGRPEQLRWLFRRYGEQAINEFVARDRAMPVRTSRAWSELLGRRRGRAA